LVRGTGIASIAFGVLLAGCSAELEQYNADADTGSTHALIQIQRSVSVDGTSAPRAEALAGFVRVPADTESSSVYELLGFETALPDVGQCRVHQGEREATPSPVDGRVELLEAGDVLVGTGGAETTLAPHAFPTVSNLVSGVVYTTRDRSSAVLPAASSYSIRTTGGLNVPGLDVSRHAPQELSAVTVGGVALSDVTQISLKDPVDLTWAVGSPGDRVVAEMATADGSIVAACTFRDDAGAGTVPGGTLPETGPGRLSLHRVRNAAFSAPGLDTGEIGFDFELVEGVNFVQ
jgi:hypothetical protein